MKRKKNYLSSGFDLINAIILTILCIIFIYPILMTFSLSISSVIELGNKKMTLLPVGFSLDSYKLLLSDKRILRYYANTIIYAGLNVITMLLSTSMLAYPLIFNSFKERKIITVMLVITMFFSGGMIPLYLVIRSIGLYDSIWSIILPSSLGAYNVIIFKTFFMQLTPSYRESAIIDGAGEFTVLFKIILPLSKALLATFSLFTIVGQWNGYMSALLYLKNQDKHPIQMFLRKILLLMDYKDMERLGLISTETRFSSRTVRSAAIIITILPIFFAYPMFQKYFTKGIMVGSIKG